MPDWWIGGVEIVLGAAAVVLTGVAIAVAIVAFWGYRDIKAASIRSAEAEAHRIAEQVARSEVRAFLDIQGEGTDISAAYQDKPS